MKPITLLVIFCLSLLSCQNLNEDSNLTTVDTSNLREHIKEKDYTLMYFWTTWCGPCRKALKETLPEVVKIIDTTKVQFITVAVSKDDEKIKNILTSSRLEAKKYKLDFIGPDIFLNHKLALKNTLDDLFPRAEVWKNAVPVFVLINKEGKIISSKLPKDLNNLTAILNKEGIVGHQVSDLGNRKSDIL